MRDIVKAAVRRRLPPEGRGQVWLIGSLALGDFGPRSDVDLVIDGLDLAAIDALERDISREAELPVDLLRLSELPPSFRARVLAEGVALHDLGSP